MSYKNDRNIYRKKVLMWNNERRQKEKMHYISAFLDNDSLVKDILNNYNLKIQNNIRAIKVYEGNIQQEIVLKIKNTLSTIRNIMCFCILRQRDRRKQCCEVIKQ